MKPLSDIGKVKVLPNEELVMADFSNIDVDNDRPITSISDGTTIVESHRSIAKESTSEKKTASKSSAMRFIPTFFEGFQEHIKSRLLNGCILMIFPAVIFVFFGSSAWIDTALFSSPESSPSLQSIFVPSFPLFIGKPAPDGFHPRILVSNRFTWPVSNAEVECSLDTYVLQDDISSVFPECGPYGDHAAYPFCISPQVLSKNISNTDGIVDLVDFNIHGLPGAYKVKCSANLAGSTQSTSFWVSLVGTVASLQASFADKFTSRVQINTCGTSIPLPKVIISVKNVDPSAVSRQVFVVALQYPALLALGLTQHSDLASSAPGAPVVEIEHVPILASGDFSTSVDTFLVSWSANAFVLAIVSEGRFGILKYLEAPVSSQFNAPSQHISIIGCPQSANIEIISAPPPKIDSSIAFSLRFRVQPAPLAPIRVILYAYCPKCLDETILKIGILSKSKVIYSRSSTKSNVGSFTFSSSSFSRVGQAGRYFYAIAVAGHIYSLAYFTDVSSPSVFLHLWTPNCFIECNMTHLDAGRSYHRGSPYVGLRFASGASAPSRTVRFFIQSTLSTASSIVVVSGSDSDEYGFVRLSSFSILVSNMGSVGALSLWSNSDSSTSNLLQINGSIRHCITPVALCSFVSITQGFPEQISGGEYFSGTIQGTAMSSNGEGVSTEICVFFDGIPAACSTSDASGNVSISNVFIPVPVSAESSSLIIWYLAENVETISASTASMKRRCGYLPACTSFSMASFISRNTSTFFTAVITNGRLLNPGVYAVTTSFTTSPTVSLELSCIFPESSLNCIAMASYVLSVKVLQVQRSSRVTALVGQADASCNYVAGAKWFASCTLLKGIIWAQLQVKFGGRALSDIYVHFSDPSLLVSKYIPKYSSTFTTQDSNPSSDLSGASMVGGSIGYVNNIFFSTGVFAPLQHPGLTLRINGSDIDIAYSASNVIDQTLEPSAPVIDRSASNLPDAPNLINGTRVEIFSKLDAPVKSGVYALKLCFEFHAECLDNVVLPSLTVTQPSLVAAALPVPDFAVLSRHGGNAPTFSARVNPDDATGINDSNRWSDEVVIWSFHDASKNVISEALHSSAMQRYSNTQNPYSTLDALSANEFFAEFLPDSFTPPVGSYFLSAKPSCCGQKYFSSMFLVDYAVQSLVLISPTPQFVVTLQTFVLSVDVRSLSGSGLPGRLVTVTPNSNSPISLCHEAACYAATNSLGIANILFSVTMAVPGSNSFKIHSGNKAIFFTTNVLSEAADFKIIKDLDPTGAADLAVDLPCAAAFKLKSAVILTSKPENDWASYNFPQFRVADSAGNGLPGLVASLRLLSCSMQTPVPSFGPTESRFVIQKIRNFGDGGSYTIDKFSLTRESTSTDVYKLEICIPGLGCVTTAPFLVRSVEVPDPVAVSTSRSFLIVGLPAVLVVLFANMRQRQFLTFIIATGAIGLYTLIALIYCSDAITLKGLNKAPTLMVGSMLLMLLALALNTALCGVILVTYVIRTDYYDSNIMRIMKALSGLLTKVKPLTSESISSDNSQQKNHVAANQGSSEVVDLDAIIQAQDKPSIWQRFIAFFVTKRIVMDSKGHAEILAEINAKKRKAMALLFKASGSSEDMALSGFSFHSRMFAALSVSFVALLISFLICTTLVDWLEVLLGLGRAKVVQSRWSKVRPDASLKVSPPLLFAGDERAKYMANQSIGPQGIMFAVMDTLSEFGYDSYFYLLQSLRSGVQLSCIIVFAMYIYQWVLSFKRFRERVMEFREYPSRIPLKSNPPSESAKLPAMQFWASLISSLLLTGYFSALSTIAIWKNSRDLIMQLLLWPALIFGGVESLVWTIQRYQQFHCIGAKNLFKHRMQFEQLDYISVHLQFISYPGMSLLRLLVQIAEFGAALGRVEFDILPHEVRYWNPALVSSNSLIALDNAYNGPTTSVMANIFSNVLEQRRVHEKKLGSAYRKDAGRLETYKQNLQSKRTCESRWKLLYSIVSSPQFLQTRQHSVPAKLRIAPKATSWDAAAAKVGGNDAQLGATKPTMRQAASIVKQSASLGRPAKRS